MPIAVADGLAPMVAITVSVFLTVGLSLARHSNSCLASSIDLVAELDLPNSISSKLIHILFVNGKDHRNVIEGNAHGHKCGDRGYHPSSARWRRR